MKIKTTEVIAGTTFRATFVSTGTTVDSARSTLYDKGESLVGSVSAINSGDGHFFAIHRVQTPGWYVNEWVSVIAANTYFHRQFIRAIRPEVD